MEADTEDGYHVILHGKPSEAKLNQAWWCVSVITALGGAEVGGSGVPSQPGLPREMLSQNPRAGDAA